MIPTWNYVMVHLRGTAQILGESLPVLRRTVDHLEAAVARPWSLEQMSDGGREMPILPSLLRCAGSVALDRCWRWRFATPI